MKFKERERNSMLSFGSAVLWLIMVVVWLGLTGAALAQTALTGGLRGAVTDKTGAALPGGQVQIESKTLLIRRETVTDARGHFTFLGLTPAADYRLTAVAAGFRPASLDGITVVSEETIALDIGLEVAAVNENIDIAATDGTALASSPEISSVLNGQRLRELPSNGRILGRFALSNPHVRNTAGLGGDGLSATRLSINGQIFRETHYKLDGNSNFDALFNNAPLQGVSVSAVQEFKVLTNQFSAEYGGTSSGFLVVTTKTGSDELHGEGFFFGRPSGIQARPPLASLRAPNQLLQFGAAIGGPVIKDKTYFFANYERLAQDRGAFIQSPAPVVFTGELRDQLALIRVDHKISEGHTLAARLNGQRTTNNNPNDRISGLVQPSNGQSNVTQSVGAQITDTLTIGKLVNELRASYVNALPSNSFPLQPSVGVVRPGYSTEGFSSYSFVRVRAYQLTDQATLQVGRHVMRAGLEYVRQKLDDRSYDLFGTYTFAAGAPKPNEMPTQYTQRFGEARLYYGQTRFAGFIQDDWRVNNRLTLNLGMRYDYQSIIADKNNFGPRIGLAYDLMGDGNTVVRAGIGVYYDQPFFHGFTQRYLLNAPQALTLTATLTPGQPGFPTFPNSLPRDLSSLPPGATVPPRSLFLEGSDLRSPYTWQETVGVQHSFAGDWTISADYIHTFQVKQLTAYDINAASSFPRTAPGQLRSVTAADATRPFSTYLGTPVRRVLESANGGKSYYNALSLSLAKRFARRYQFDARYVYSSAINSVTDDHLGANPNEYSDVVGAERGASDFHQRHRFVAYGTVLLPFAASLTGVATLASGLPVNAITGVDNNGDTVIFDRPINPATGVPYSRNAFRAPRQTTFDLSLARDINLGNDRAKLELRVDVFNLFNGSNYQRLNNVYGNGAAPAATFLQPIAGISNVDPGRQFQFGMRLKF